MANSSGNTDVQLRDRDSFLDAKNWDYLETRWLMRYNLPDWHEPCQKDVMELWLDRMDISKKVYMDYTQTSFEDWIKLNPRWPLRAWIGLMLEIKAIEE